MSALFDMESAEKSVLAADELAECKELMASRNTFEAGDKNGVLSANMPGGTSLSGNRSMLVQGSLNGTQGNLCKIQVKGDLVITGNLYHAQISCGNLYLGGDIQYAQIIATGNITVGGEIINAQLSTGSFKDQQNHIEDLERDRGRSQEERESLDRQIYQEEKRVDRSCKTTRIPLNFNVSRIITHENHQVRINLSSFYKSLGDLAEGKRKVALMEFFAKGVVGYLARTNRKYITDNPVREKVFLQLLKHLRVLFSLVAERDFLVQKQQMDREEIDRIVEELREQKRQIHVRGGLHPESTLRFIIPRVRRLEDDEIEFSDNPAELKVLADKTDQLRLERVSAEGGKNSEVVAEDQLEEITLQATQGNVVWNAVAVATPT